MAQLTRSEVSALVKLEQEHSMTDQDAFGRGIAAGIRIALTVLEYIPMAPTAHERDASGCLVLCKEGVRG